MAVLLLFNDAERLSYEEVEAATGIPEEDLKRVLQSLACVKVRAAGSGGGGGAVREVEEMRRSGLWLADGCMAWLPSGARQLQPACFPAPCRPCSHPPPLASTMPPLALLQGKAVLRKEPMSKDVRPGDAFSVNDAFTSKLYKVKIGMVTAQVGGRLWEGRLRGARVLAGAAPGGQAAGGRRLRGLAGRGEGAGGTYQRAGRDVSVLAVPCRAAIHSPFAHPPARRTAARERGREG